MKIKEYQYAPGMLTLALEVDSADAGFEALTLIAALRPSVRQTKEPPSSVVSVKELSGGEAPAAPPNQAPPEVLSATNFRQVMNHMVKVGHRDAGKLAALLETWREEVPALARVSGPLADRVARALEVLMLDEQSTA